MISEFGFTNPNRIGGMKRPCTGKCRLDIRYGYYCYVNHEKKWDSCKPSQETGKKNRKSLNLTLNNNQFGKKIDPKNQLFLETNKSKVICWMWRVES